MAEIDDTSSDYKAMEPYWKKVNTIMQGTEAMREAGKDYLPQFEEESDPSYKLRIDNAKFTNIFRDIVENLSARPFSKEVKLTASPRMTELCEDIDGQGNIYFVFMADWFKGAMTRGIEWVLVDYTRTDPYIIDSSGQARRKSVTEERQSGARPYCVHVPATDLLAVYSVMLEGVEQVVHARIRENHTLIQNYQEIGIEQIRILQRIPLVDEVGDIIGYGKPEFQIWKRVEGPNKTMIWEKKDEGELFITKIPLVPLILGDRENGWVVNPAMRDAADLQIEYYQAENGLKNLKTLTAFPMLTASGVEPEMDTTTKKPRKAPVGPRAVLYAPPQPGPNAGPPGSWAFIEPAGTSLSFLAGDLKEQEKALREVGRQPLTANSGNVTVITSAFAAAKGNSAIQQWGLEAKDAMELVLGFMAEWEGDSKAPELDMDLDFSLEMQDKDTFTDVQAMRKNGDLSQRTLWSEAQRRGTLSPNFDAEKEEKALEDEQPDPLDDDEVKDALGNPVKIDPLTGLPIKPEEDNEDPE